MYKTGALSAELRELAKYSVSKIAPSLFSDGGSAVFRCAYMPLVLLVAPIFDQPTNTKRFETAATLRIGQWGAIGGNDKRKIGAAR